MMKKVSKNLNSAFALLVGLAIMLFVFLGILFPTFVYQLNAPDTHAIALWQKKIGEKNLLHVSPFFDYQFNSIALRLQSKQGFAETPGSFEVYKGYVFQGFERGADISNEEQLNEIIRKGNESEIANGSLVSYNDTVYFISDGQARPILSPEIFLQKGFKWENIQEIGGDAFGLFAKGEELNLSSLHPNGTLFAVGEDLFFVVDEKSRAVNAELASLIPDSVKPVLLDSGQLENIGSCLVTKKTKNTIKCSFEPTQTTEISGNDYIFQVPASVYNPLEKGSATFKTFGGMRKDVAYSSLSRVKALLATRYFPDILK